MYFKYLTGEIPINIVKKVCEYDNTYKLRMKNVINDINRLNKTVEEYWYMDECLYYMTDNEERYRLKIGLPITNIDYPLPKKRCFRFWNTRKIPTLEEVTPPRDEWKLHLDFNIYPSNCNTYYKGIF